MPTVRVPFEVEMLSDLAGLAPTDDVVRGAVLDGDHVADALDDPGANVEIEIDSCRGEYE